MYCVRLRLVLSEPEAVGYSTGRIRCSNFDIPDNSRWSLMRSVGLQDEFFRYYFSQLGKFLGIIDIAEVDTSIIYQAEEFTRLIRSMTIMRYLAMSDLSYWPIVVLDTGVQSQSSASTSSSTVSFPSHFSLKTTTIAFFTSTGPS